jgi:hypothetical protein
MSSTLTTGKTEFLPAGKCGNTKVAVSLVCGGIHYHIHTHCHGEQLFVLLPSSQSMKRKGKKRPIPISSTTAAALNNATVPLQSPCRGERMIASLPSSQSLQRKRKKWPLPMSSTTAAASNHVSVPNETDVILPVEHQQKTIISAELKLHAIYKAGDDYNALHTTLCGPDGGFLRGLLLGNEKSGGRSATVHELWNGWAKDDPLNSSLSFARAIENGILKTKQAVVCETAGTAKNHRLHKLLGQFSDCICQFQHHDKIRFFRAGKLNEGLVLALSGLVNTELHLAAQIDQTDHLVNSSTMIGMIEYLLKQSNDNLVCIKTAQDAFSSMYLGKKCQDTHRFDLKCKPLKTSISHGVLIHDVAVCFNLATLQWKNLDTVTSLSLLWVTITPGFRE